MAIKIPDKALVRVMVIKCESLFQSRIFQYPIQRADGNILAMDWNDNDFVTGFLENRMTAGLPDENKAIIFQGEQGLVNFICRQSHFGG